jgi:hypothetical protein
MTPLDAAGPFEVLGGFQTPTLWPGRHKPPTEQPQLYETMRMMASVCTGALILGAGGVLKSLRAVTYWWVMDALVGYVAKPVTEMVVWGGKVLA